MYAASMQLSTSISKILILTVVSCSLLIVWNSGNKNSTAPTGFNYQTSEDTSNAKPADSIWASMSSELKLDHKVQSAQVRAEIRKLLADKDNLKRILNASGPYIYFIYKQIQERGLPAELALIPVIESEFNPNDRSHKGALGLWQLMSGTAHELGVKIKSGYDGRRNVVASTNAALAYFKDLGNMFKGNWYLAIAAYNCGQGRIESAVRRTGSHNFWNLPLPKETKYYVPKLLAVAAIIKDPEKYGVELPHITNEPYFSKLSLKKSVNLEEVAKSLDINVKTLYTLNPDYRRGTPKKGANTLLVPIDKVSDTKAQFADSIVETPGDSSIVASLSA